MTANFLETGVLSETTQKYQDFEKVVRVIQSCKTNNHCVHTYKLIYFFARKWNDWEMEFELDNLLCHKQLGINVSKGGYDY